MPSLSIGPAVQETQWSVAHWYQAEKIRKREGGGGGRKEREGGWWKKGERGGREERERERRGGKEWREHNVDNQYRTHNTIHTYTHKLMNGHSHTCTHTHTHMGHTTAHKAPTFLFLAGISDRKASEKGCWGAPSALLEGPPLVPSPSYIKSVARWMGGGGGGWGGMCAEKARSLGGKRMSTQIRAEKD